MLMIYRWTQVSCVLFFTFHLIVSQICKGQTWVWVLNQITQLIKNSTHLMPIVALWTSESQFTKYLVVTLQKNCNRIITATTSHWICHIYSVTESTMQRFCEFVQIDFQESMLHWLPPPQDQAFLFEMEAFKKAGQTSRFGLPTPAPKFEDQLDDIQVAVNNAMPIYNYLKKAECDKSFKLWELQQKMWHTI